MPFTPSFKPFAFPGGNEDRATFVGGVEDLRYHLQAAPDGSALALPNGTQLLHDFFWEDIRVAGAPAFEFYHEVGYRLSDRRDLRPLLPLSFFGTHGLMQNSQYYTFNVAEDDTG